MPHAKQKVLIEQLQIGNFICMPVGWREHPFLLSNFMLTKKEQIDILKQMDVDFVYVDLHKSSLPPMEICTDVFLHEFIPADDTINNMMQEKKKQIEELSKYRRSQKRAEQEYILSCEKIKNLMDKIRNNPLYAIEEAQRLIGYITLQLFNKKNITLHLMSELPHSETFYYHALNVATLAMLIAKLADKTMEEVHLVGMAGLFHDIGNLNVPSAIFRKPSALSSPELNIYRLHPIYGVRMLNLMPSLPIEIKEIIGSHHERLDGSGYPSSLTYRDINQLTQIVSVADEYDSLCNPLLVSRKTLTPYNALALIYKHTPDKLNKQYVELLIKQIGIYPPGSVVELANGQIGLVVSINSKQLLHPYLMIFDRQVPKNSAAIINLSELSLPIKRVLFPSEITDEIRDYLQPGRFISYFFDTEEEN